MQPVHLIYIYKAKDGALGTQPNNKQSKATVLLTLYKTIAKTKRK
jgi:hypothetical protein